MGKSFDRVIDAFHNQGLKVKTSGQGKADAQAPGHSHADLSVSITDIGGRVLVWSHSDPTDQVLATLGLSMSDLFDDEKGITYQYPDGRNVSRSPAKRFSQSGNTKGNQLYRADRLKDARVVFFVEGEQDVHALESVGLVATCTAMGAGKAHLFDLTPLYGKAVQIVRDMDEPGLAHATQVAALLEGHAQVELLEPADGKDAADHVASGHTVDDFRRVDVPEPAAPVDAEFEQAVEAERRYLSVKSEARQREADAKAAVVGSKLHPKTLGEILDQEFEHDWLVPGLLERRDRLILTGFEGTGKSHLLRQIAIATSAGLHPFDRNARIRPAKVLVVDAENSEQQWSRGAKYVTELSESFGAGKPRINTVVNAGTRLDFTKHADVNEVHRLLDEHKPDVLYIGPLYKLVPKEISTDDDAAPLIVALDAFRERGVILLMEAHAGKSMNAAGSRDLRPRGSSALLGWPEFGFGLHPSDDDENVAALSRWRGDREQREWPTHLRRGSVGEMPWMPTTREVY